MYNLIKEFPTQLRTAIEIGEKAYFKTTFPNGIRNVVACGLGGSGIGGDLLAELLRDELKVPVVVNKGYKLPAFVDSSSLLILSSYSGNTEETISCAEQAVARGLKPVCVTSGGKLEEIAKANNFDLITIPAGFPPRACLGYSGTQLFFILKNFGLIGDGFVSAFAKSALLLETEQAQIMKEAAVLAEKLVHKVIIAYADEKYQSVALR
jgi:glucose/mannose-6-phosphate isomerase